MTCWKQIAAACALIAGMARGEMIYEGTHEVGLSGALDFDTKDDAVFALDVSFGRFVMDYWEIGCRGAFSTSDVRTSFAGGLFTEHHFEMNITVLPYVGASVGLVAVDFDGDADVEGSDAAFTVGGELGLKGFLTEEVALSGGVEFTWASDAVYRADNDVEDTEIRLKIGLRFYY